MKQKEIIDKFIEILERQGKSLQSDISARRAITILKLVLRELNEK